jgi:hypothetical protein
MDKSKNTLWVFGCSFTAEYEPIDNLYSPFKLPFEFKDENKNELMKSGNNHKQYYYES